MLNRAGTTVLGMVAAWSMLGACAGSTSPSRGQGTDDAGIAPSAEQDSASAEFDDGGAGPSPSCSVTPARIEADVEFEGRTIHFSADADESVGSEGTRLEAFAPDDAGVSFPFGVMVVFPHEGIAAGKSYPQFFGSGAVLVGVLYEDAPAAGREASVINEGSIMFSHVGTGNCDPTVGAFENIRGISDGPNHPFNVHVAGTFRGGTR